MQGATPWSRTMLAYDKVGKRVALLHEIAPKMRAYGL
jgi:hypothetical protein